MDSVLQAASGFGGRKKLLPIVLSRKDREDHRLLCIKKRLLKKWQFIASFCLLGVTKVGQNDAPGIEPRPFALETTCYTTTPHARSTLPHRRHLNIGAARHRWTPNAMLTTNKHFLTSCDFRIHRIELGSADSDQSVDDGLRAGGLTMRVQRAFTTCY